jgi:hypothetical protein
MVLIGFVLAGKHFEDQEFRSSENMVAIVRFVAVVVLVLGSISTRDFA